jgi:hypothetical protein
MESLDQIITLAGRLFVDYTANILDSSSIPEARDLLELGRGQRPYLAIGKETLQNIWNEIRESNTQSTMLLDLSAKFHLALLADDIDVIVFCRSFAEAFEICGRQQSAVDDTILERAYVTKQQETLFYDNMWYVYLYLIGQSKTALEITGLKVPQ